MQTFIIVLIIGGVAALLFFLMYNLLVARKNAVDQAFAAIDAMCKKRYDLIPNLVATVKQYATHEQETLEKVTALRNQAAAGNVSADEAVDLNNQISEALGRIQVAVEAYPDLKANENFLHLQRSLNEVEEQLSASRRAFNAAVTDYNNAVEMLPTNILANFLGYRPKRLFEAAAQERRNVEVGKLFNA